VVCRSIIDERTEQGPEADPASNIIILLVTRETIAANSADAYQVLGEPELMGHISTSGPHTRFVDFYVPNENLLAPPAKGAGIIERAFGISAALVGAMATGIMRTAIKTALDFAKSDTRGGSKLIISHQSVADKLIDCKIRMETSRLLTWKAAHGLDNQSIDWHVQLETALQAKIYTSDVAVECVLDAMKAVGMSSYSKKTRFPRLLEDVMCYSLFDGGNVGIRRRQLQLIMSSEGYDV
jgi:alkylation response protein AidB-like acyl-CoA dehydrogenase